MLLKYKIHENHFQLVAIILCLVLIILDPSCTKSNGINPIPSNFGDLNYHNTFDSISTILSTQPTDSLYLLTDSIFRSVYSINMPIKTTLVSITDFMRDSCIAVSEIILDPDSLGIAIKFINGKIGGYRFTDTSSLGATNICLQKNVIVNKALSELGKASKIACGQYKIMIWAPIQFEFPKNNISKNLTAIGINYNAWINNDCNVIVFLDTAKYYDIIIVLGHGIELYNSSCSEANGKIHCNSYLNGEVGIALEAGWSYEDIATHMIELDKKYHLRNYISDYGTEQYSKYIIRKSIPIGPVTIEYNWNSEEKPFYGYVSSKIFRKAISTKLFNNSIVILNTCFSNQNDIFGIAFTERGARAVIGWNNSANGEVSINATQTLMDAYINRSQDLSKILVDNRYFQHINSKGIKSSWVLFSRNTINPMIAQIPTQISTYFSQSNIDTLQKLGLTFNMGLNPPALQGIFKVSPCVLFKSNIPDDFSAGYKFSDMHFCFFNQKSDLSILSKTFYSDSTDSSTGSGGFVFGNNDSFTVCLNENGVEKGNTGNSITYKAATVISGIKTPAGISNLKYGFILSDKQNDLTKNLIDVGQCRIIRDDDLISEKVSDGISFSSTKPQTFELFRAKPLDSLAVSTYGKEISPASNAIASSEWNGSSFTQSFGEQFIFWPEKNILWIDFSYMVNKNSISKRFAPIIGLPFQPNFARFFQSQSAVGNYKVTNITFEKIGDSYYAKLDSVIVGANSNTGLFQSVLEIQMPYIASECVRISFFAVHNAKSDFTTWLSTNTAATFTTACKSGTAFSVPGIVAELIELNVKGGYSICTQNISAATICPILWSKFEEISKFDGFTDIAALPNFNQHPVSQSFFIGQKVSFTISVTGNPAPSLQWKKNGVTIPGATANTFKIESIVKSDAGLYSVTASNSQGSVTSNSATLTVKDFIPPKITLQPVSQEIDLDSKAIFFVKATGYPEPTYQWMKNNALLMGKTDDTLKILSISDTNIGIYRAIASNAAGSDTSDSATLIITGYKPPKITLQPVSLEVKERYNAIFTVQASGYPAPKYQWMKNDTIIKGETSSQLNLGQTEANDIGKYSVIVSNLMDTIKSDEATLLVDFIRVISHTEYLDLNIGDTAKFSVVVEAYPKPTYQWQRLNSSTGQVDIIRNAISTTLIIPNVQLEDADTYRLIIINSYREWDIDIVLYVNK